MIRAIQDEDLKRVQQLLRSCSDINQTHTVELPYQIDKRIFCRTLEKATALHCAVLYNKFNIVQFLLSVGLDIEHEDEYKMKPLFHAIQNNSDLTIFNLLINDGANIKHKNKFKETPLHIAVKQNAFQIVKLLIEHQVLLDSYCKDNCTPLYRAVETGNLEIIQELLKNGANVDTQCEFAKTPLIQAIENQNLEVVKLLLTYTLNLNFCDTAIYCASKLKNENIVQALIEAGADVNSTYNIFNRTPLLEATLRGQLNVIKTLIKHGADVNARDSNGKTLMHEVVMYCNLNYSSLTIAEEIVHFLRNHGTNINAVDNCDYTALHFAVSINNVKMVTILLKAGALVNTLNLSEESPLSLAVLNGNIELVILLLNNNADINFHVSYQSPLHYAVSSGNMEMLNVLLKRNPNVDTVIFRGQTPLNYAIMKKEVETVRRLISYGANVNLTTVHNSLEECPLIKAIEVNDLQVIKILLQNGANINIEVDSHTPLCYAVSWKNDLIVQLLLEYGADVNINGPGNNCVLAFAIDERSYMIVDMLLLQIFKLKVKGEHICAENLKLFDHMLATRGSSYALLYSRMMRNIIPEGYTITVYDLFTKNMVTISKYARNEDVRKILEENLNNISLDSFPYYSTMVVYNTRVAVEKAKLFEKFHNLLRFVLGHVHILPEEIILYIINLFSDKEKNDFLQQFKNYWHVSGCDTELPSSDISLWFR